ncbi:MAG: ribulose-phosphate 3-epimerase [Clostridia bacterium]|nr:ribulose-phosphate 3-epimerase [Clostridia bacterium]
MLIISPSALAADFSRLGEEFAKVERAGAQYIHLDVMDGMFVPNISFGPPMIESLRKCSSMVFDVHLMIMDPIRYIDVFRQAGADLITFHYESCDDPSAVIRAIKESGAKVAMSVKPATPPEAVYPFLNDLDMVLVMTVEPGFGGQKLIPEMIAKVRALRTYAEDNGIQIDIQVDGGVTGENLGMLTEAGANVIVAGSAIFRAENPEQVIETMRKEAELHPFVR